MRVVEISEFGGPDVLKVAERPRPKPGPGEVLIKVVAAGVNRPDVVQRYGKYPPPPGASDIPGLEVAGHIAERGAGVVQWHEGEAVCALVTGGGYAEYCVAPQAQCLRPPSRLSLVDAAAIPETFFTVWTNVFERGRLQERESILVHGGTSGIGTTAIQLAAAFGARVFATAGSDEKVAACESLGAALAVNYRTTDWVQAFRAATSDRGVDVVLDIVGGEYVRRNLDVLAVEGRLVQIAFLKSSKVELDLMPVMRRRLTITGSTLRPRSPDEKGAIARQLAEKVWPLLEAGTVKPVIHAQFPFERAADAHRMMEESRHIGKIVLAAPTSNRRHISPNKFTSGVRSAARLPIASRILSSVGPHPRNDILNDARQ
jgi:NADPH2:quinone reductase